MATVFPSPATGSTQFEHPSSVALPTFPKPTSKSSPTEIANEWLENLTKVLNSSWDSIAPLSSVFHQEGWWRDHCALSWDLRTLHTLPKLYDFLSPKSSSLEFSGAKLRETGFGAPNQVAVAEGIEWVESFFTFETKVGRGEGVLRLTPDFRGTWKCYVLYTSLQEIKDNEWAMGKRRPHGGKNTLEGDMMKGNWAERRARKKEFLDEDPTVLVIGAGQSGLNISARLQTLGLSCLTIDKNTRIGDNWRLRYRTLVTHDPVNTCHMAYLPFPPTWSFFTAKDKLGDWFECYANIMELNVWTSTVIKEAKYDDASHTWTVEVQRGYEEPRTFKPRHVVFCTGHSGEPRIPTFKGQDGFEGLVHHASQHKDASSTSEAAGKKVIVVGTGNSGHDIAQNYCENGASVTMLQRSPTHVVSAKIGLLMMTEALYGEDAPKTEDADIYAQSIPHPIGFAMARPTIRAIAEKEKETLEGLKKAGFILNSGVDGGGLFSLYLTRGGGYYIDVGCSKLIADGKIKIAQSPKGIREFTKKALVLADGTELEADVVVLATGYDNMRTSLRKALGDEVAERCKDVWDLDEEGELNAMWRPSGHPGVWYMGGNLSMTRIFSKFLALQIKAVEVGLNKQE